MTEADFEYIVQGEEVIITAVKDTSLTSVVLPETIKGYPVTGIGDSVFFKWTNLISIVIPSSIVSIGENSFSYCDNLTIITPKGSYAERYAQEFAIPCENN